MECFFCFRKSDVLKKVLLYNGYQVICKHCHSLHKLLRGETKETVLSIINAMSKKSCYTCRFFRKSKSSYCMEGMNTGVKTHTNSFPFTYANHGCSRYVGKKTSI